MRSCYDEGKRCAETLFFDYWRQHRLRIKMVRIFNTYGPRMHPNDDRVVSNFIIQAHNGEDITIYGDGTQTRSFCYVDDLIEAVVRTMDTPDDFTGPINIGEPARIHDARLDRQAVLAEFSDIALNRYVRLGVRDDSPDHIWPRPGAVVYTRCRSFCQLSAAGRL
jgi:UDP-glucuronate decarboxylase